MESNRPILVNKMPPGFRFKYCPVSRLDHAVRSTQLRIIQENRACRWKVTFDRTLCFSLVFGSLEDYLTIQAVMSNGEKADKNSKGRTGITHVASMTTQASQTVNELFRSLEVHRLPRIEEERT